MNFIKFPVGATNIFPLANSTAGGQLLTEFNLRSRESVATSPEIEYMVGPSYTHSMNDYMLTRDIGAPSVLTIGRLGVSNRAIVNGHFVELFGQIVIDLNEANLEARTKKEAVLKGTLCVGIRAMYSTIQTEAARADAMKIENKDNYYEGVQIVILPKDGELGTRFTLPEDSPNDVNKVNAHLKLGEIVFSNGSIQDVSQNESKCQYVDGSRISNISSMLSDGYVKKSKLNPEWMYVFGGWGSTTGEDTWDNATDSLMIWDYNSRMTVGNIPSGYPMQAEFDYDPTTGVTSLLVPHAQPDALQTTSGEPGYYPLRKIDLPVADYGRRIGGTVGPKFIESMIALDARINEFYSLASGKMRKYIEGFSSVDDRKVKLVDETPIQEGWSPGDYVVVGVDNAIFGDAVTYTRAPSTMYVVIPGLVTNIAKINSPISDGTLIRKVDVTTAEYPNPLTLDEAKDILSINVGNIDRGEKDKSYFQIDVVNSETSEVTSYYYKVSGTGPMGYAGIEDNTQPILLTGEIGLATESTIGGFLNVPETAVGQGYVRRNEDGVLEIMDWDVLVSGVLAYQLGQNVEIPAGYDIDQIQENLDNYINQRVAFPNAAQIAVSTQEGSDPKIIHVFVHLSASDLSERKELKISDIDSRFGTSTYLHIDGQANSNLTIKIEGCGKLRVDVNGLSGDPIINIKDTNLYYDATILDKAYNISGLKLWYEKQTDGDLDLTVDGMTVQITNRPDAIGNDDYWTTYSPNDNHYSYALRSLTFAPDGSIINCSMLVTDTTTANINLNPTAAVFKFNLPQTFGFPYPTNRLTKPLKVTGQFVTAYPATEGYIIKDTSFTALTQRYEPGNTSAYVEGNIAFYTRAAQLPVTGAPEGQDRTIDCWRSGEFHVFYGGVAE